MITVALIILNFNGKEDTLECLRTVKSSDTSGFKLISLVVDNASDDGSSEAIKKKFPDIELITNKNNLGFAHGNNKGIKWAISAGADYLFILNNDTLLSKKTIENLTGAFENHKEWGIAAPKIYFAKGYEFHQDRYKESERGKVIWYAGGIIDWKNVTGKHRGVDEVDRSQYDIVSETDYASGCAMMVKREVFEKVGLFDKKYFLYYEDLDFNIRVRKEGYKIGYYPKAILWHKNAASVLGSGSTLQDYYISRNRLLFGLNYAPIVSKIALFKESIKLLISGRKWQKKGVWDFYLGRYGKGSYTKKNF